MSNLKGVSKRIGDAFDALELANTCLLDAIEDAPPTPTSDHILALENAAEAHAGPAHEKRALIELLDIVREV